MDFLTIMETRKSCRAYQDKSVSREDLVKIVEAGRLSPSGCNAQPWKFIVVDEPEAKASLCDALVVLDGKTGAPWREQAPAFIIVCETPNAKVKPVILEYYNNSQRFAQGDIGGAAMNMCHEAMDLGLSTCMLGMTDQAKLQAAFGIPADCEVRMVIAVGYSAETNNPPKVRKPFDEICSFNCW